MDLLPHYKTTEPMGGSDSEPDKRDGHHRLQRCGYRQDLRLFCAEPRCGYGKALDCPIWKEQVAAVSGRHLNAQALGLYEKRESPDVKTKS